ncbi:hypothetical protein AAZX31_11G138200 [Glycine max]|uniref:Secreted protein n=1 Tax=Glycine max TaxID=3847 RepID=K7LPQ2_SOYBN|nr:hypothetical protein GYH30_031030 [Glycine max]KRH29834.1 hypothetical protein GLYMA_11G141900v4 [Glycine max]
MRIISALVCRSTLLFPLPQFLCTCHHSTTKLFVAGLSYDANELILIDAFRQHSEIIEGSHNFFQTQNITTRESSLIS